MALFDTTQQQPKFYGLNPTQGVADRSGEIDTSLLSGAVDLAQMGLDTAIKEDKNNVLNAAQQAASELNNEYLSRSPSEQAYLQGQAAELTNQMSSATDQMKAGLQQKLMDVNERLSRAKAQGAMSNYEYQRRLTAISQDLASENPVYANDIAQTVQQVSGRAGIGDVISADEAMAKAQAKAQDDQYKMLIETVAPYVVDPYALTDNQLYAKFLEIKDLDVTRNEVTRLVDDRNLLDTLTQSDMKEKFKIMGPAKIRRVIQDEVSSALYAVARDNTKSYQERVEAGRDVIRFAKDKYFNLASKLPQDDKEVAFFVSNMDKMFEGLENQAETDFSLKGIQDYMANKASIFEKGISIDYMSKYGTTAEIEERLTNKMSMYLQLKKGGLLNSQLKKDIQSTLEKLTIGNTNPNGYLPEELAVLEDPAFSKVISNTINQLGSANFAQGDMDLISNYLAVINNRDAKGEALNKLLDSDNALTAFSNMTSEAFGRAFEDDNMRENLQQNLAQYKDFIQFELQRIASGPQELSMNLDPVTGRFETQENDLKSTVKRLNVYLKIRARMENQDVKSVARTIYENEFGDVNANQDN